MDEKKYKGVINVSWVGFAKIFKLFDVIFEIPQKILHFRYFTSSKEKERNNFRLWGENKNEIFLYLLLDNADMKTEIRSLNSK